MAKKSVNVLWTAPKGKGGKPRAKRIQVAHDTVWPTVEIRRTKSGTTLVNPRGCSLVLMPNMIPQPSSVDGIRLSR